MKKTKEAATHRMGKETGYELRDGKYYIAQVYRDRFAQLWDESDALDVLLGCVMAHLERDGIALARAKRELWQAIRDDLGQPFSDGWAYDSVGGCIFEKPKEPLAPTRVEGQP